MASAIDLTNVDLTGIDLSVIDRIALWYGNLPSEVRTCLTVAIGAAIAYVVFRIVAGIIKGVLVSVIAAVLAFLLTTVPGNMLLSQAYDRVEQQVSTSLRQTGAGQ
ncbi:hypothetical protein [Bifidobacterium platyrrhinorum]|uniref:Uncharacterized protein n=1 Tax=Bifidobacterium platyrrhinorum TaxID=2661628 RepID=A0A6L9SPZ9_9BIFI|nr:hypothetical protein [Bifidobacterium platyrrhinorum]NEG54534.1 hypothetical protein [Bifidobacterium platyrrhinorum]